MPVALRQKLWFQHNGAPVHYREDVQWQLYVTYPGWIGCVGADCTLLLEASSLLYLCSEVGNRATSSILWCSIPFCPPQQV